MRNRKRGERGKGKNTINNSKIDEGNIRIKEILNFLRNQGYTSLDLLDELESLIAAKTQTVRN